MIHALVVLERNIKIAVEKMNKFCENFCVFAIDKGRFLC